MILTTPQMPSRRSRRPTPETLSNYELLCSCQDFEHGSSDSEAKRSKRRECCPYSENPLDKKPSVEQTACTWTPKVCRMMAQNLNTTQQAMIFEFCWVPGTELLQMYPELALNNALHHCFPSVPTNTSQRENTRASRCLQYTYDPAVSVWGQYPIYEALAFRGERSKVMLLLP